MDILQGNLGANATYEIDAANGKIVAKVEVGLVDFVKKAAEWVKSRRPGGVEDPIADGFVKLVEALAAEDAEKAKVLAAAPV